MGIIHRDLKVTIKDPPKHPNYSLRTYFMDQETLAQLLKSPTLGLLDFYRES